LAVATGLSRWVFLSMRAFLFKEVFFHFSCHFPSCVSPFWECFTVPVLRDPRCKTVTSVPRVVSYYFYYCFTLLRVPHDSCSRAT
jgi:hypothetical protein